ncbi:MAG TPA: Rab family GTPase [Candidatus Lokiarchaeia archaeon]|nr:Rab family GTPase [Candidatus Lokiarchaeia archaeon]
MVDYKFKISLLGEAGVGKTSLILRYVKNFFKEDLKSTIGTNFMTKAMNIGDTTVQLLIFDIGAQKIFSSMRVKYFQGSNAAIAVYDVTSRESLHALPEWIISVKDVCGNIPIIIVGNKADLVNERAVLRSDAEALADRFNCIYEEASAKTGESVEAVFEKITCACLETVTDYTVA